MQRVPRAVLALAFLSAALSTLAAVAASAPTVGAPVGVPRAGGKIAVDGRLDDPAWQQAAVIDSFYETFPADNTEPPVRTRVLLTYDDRYFYIGIHAYDPQPARIRAPFVQRDNVIGTDDNVAVF